MISVHHPEYDYFRANPDRLVRGQKLGLEIKTAGIRQANKWGDPADPDAIIPAHYRAQAQWYMGVLDYPRWDVAVSIGGAFPLIFHLTRDDEFIAELQAIAHNFWNNNVLANEPPTVDGSLDCQQYYSEKYRTTAVDVRSATKAEERAMRQYREVLAEEKDIAQRKAVLRNRLLARMGDARKITSERYGSITATAGKPSIRTDWKSLANGMLERMSEEMKKKLISSHSNLIEPVRSLRPYFIE